MRDLSIKKKVRSLILTLYAAMLVALLGSLSLALHQNWQLKLQSSQNEMARQAGIGNFIIEHAVINAAKVWPYQLLQPYSYDDLMRAADLIPFALVGTVLGAYITKKIADAWFYRLVQAGLFAVSIKLITDVVL